MLVLCDSWLGFSSWVRPGLVLFQSWCNLQWSDFLIKRLKQYLNPHFTPWQCCGLNVLAFFRVFLKICFKTWQSTYFSETKRVLKMSTLFIQWYLNLFGTVKLHRLAQCTFTVRPHRRREAFLTNLIVIVRKLKIWISIWLVWTISDLLTPRGFSR